MEAKTGQFRNVFLTFLVNWYTEYWSLDPINYSYYNNYYLTTKQQCIVNRLTFHSVSLIMLDIALFQTWEVKLVLTSLSLKMAFQTLNLMSTQG